ncbi:MAG: biotin transporter BioY [Ignavibacteriaceae bacterium]|jgi:biotin transport system substrate-specific component|nr:biotin transporter BioY [Ignavibacteriaceae bacterium]
MQTKYNGKTKALSFPWIKIIASEYFGIVSFAFLTAIAAQITIPIKPVPFTLQTMTVVLAGAMLGAKKGAYSQLLYLAAGAIGLPVFAVLPESGFGIARFFSTTGGFLLAFPLAAFATGLLVEKYKNYFAVVSSMFLGEVIIILSGTIFLNAFFIHNFSETFKVAAAIFSVWTAVKVFTAAAIYFGLKKAKAE